MNLSTYINHLIATWSGVGVRLLYLMP